MKHERARVLRFFVVVFVRCVVGKKLHDEYTQIEYNCFTISNHNFHACKNDCQIFQKKNSRGFLTHF